MHRAVFRISFNKYKQRLPLGECDSSLHSYVSYIYFKGVNVWQTGKQMKDNKNIIAKMRKLRGNN